MTLRRSLLLLVNAQKIQKHETAGRYEYVPAAE